jgi:hypothetical protein
VEGRGRTSKGALDVVGTDDKAKECVGIGFRDMNFFNQALLAKQGWRLIHNPNSLCARVLKSKYFPNGNLLDTIFASDASPVWRGIEFGLELLKRGLFGGLETGKTYKFKEISGSLEERA